MRKLFIGLIVFIAIIGCYSESVQEKAYAQPNCVISSVYSAWTWGMVYNVPVRIAVTNIKEGLDHSQAEALINGTWTPITERYNEFKGVMEIVVSERHIDKAPYRYLTLKQWIDEQIKYSNQQ